MARRSKSYTRLKRRAKAQEGIIKRTGWGTKTTAAYNRLRRTRIQIDLKGHRGPSRPRRRKSR